MNARALNNLLPLLLVVAGTLLPAQFAINSALAGQTYSVVLAAAVSYSVGTLLGVGLLIPDLAYLGVICIGAVPVLAALWVAVAGWQRDRRLSYAALAALGGLVAVVIVKQFIKH